MATTVHTLQPSVRAERDSATQVIGAVIGLGLLISLIVAAFALPALKARPHDVPIGLAGPAAATGSVARSLQASQPGAFAVTAYADESTLRVAIQARAAYGGLVLTPAGPRMLTASAASPAIATALTSLAQGLGRAEGVTIPTEDVVPLPADDPHGVGLATLLLPMLIGAVAPVAMMIRVAPRGASRIAAVLAANLTVGFSVVAVLRYGLGVLAGNYLLVSLTLALTLAAISMTVLGLHGLASWPGFGLGVLTMLLIGLPLSGVQSAPELLPSGWGQLGQFLPPGAGGSALRSFAYFDGQGTGSPLIVLAVWAGVGLIFALFAVVRGNLQSRAGRR
jgi:hypothetical protein